MKRVGFDAYKRLHRVHKPTAQADSVFNSIAQVYATNAGVFESVRVNNAMVVPDIEQFHRSLDALRQLDMRSQIQSSNLPIFSQNDFTSSGGSRDVATPSVMPAAHFFDRTMFVDSVITCAVTSALLHYSLTGVSSFSSRIALSCCMGVIMTNARVLLKAYKSFVGDIACLGIYYLCQQSIVNRLSANRV